MYLNDHSTTIMIVKTCKQLKCSLRDDWFKPIVYVLHTHTHTHTHTEEYYSAIKKNEIMPFTTTWMDLEIIVLSEVSQTEEDKCYMTSFICGI